MHKQFAMLLHPLFKIYIYIESATGECSAASQKQFIILPLHYDFVQYKLLYFFLSNKAICLGQHLTPQTYHLISMVSCQKGPTRHAYAWQIGPFWQDTLDFQSASKTGNTIDTIQETCNPQVKERQAFCWFRVWKEFLMEFHGNGIMKISALQIILTLVGRKLIFMEYLVSSLNQFLHVRIIY